MRTQVSKWGHSLAIRIPRAYARQLGVAEGSAVDLVANRDSLVLRKTRYALDDLLARVTPRNRHGETTTGRPVGREEW